MAGWRQGNVSDIAVSVIQTIVSCISNMLEDFLHWGRVNKK